MNRNFVGSRARQFTAGLALCTIALFAQADPSVSKAIAANEPRRPGQCLIDIC